MTLRREARGAYEEVAPATCHNGHPLGVGRMHNAMGEHPVHGIRVRVWICGTCGDETFATLKTGTCCADSAELSRLGPAFF